MSVALTMRHSSPSGDIIGSASALPDSALHVACVSVAGLRIKLRTTSPELGAVYAARIGTRCGEGFEGTCDLRFDLLETGRLGWTPVRERLAENAGGTQPDRVFSGNGMTCVLPDLVSDCGVSEPLTVFDRTSGVGVQLVDTASQLPPWDSGSPFRILVHLAFAARGWRLVHAGSLAVRGTGVLLIGEGGAGKSGTVLAGMKGGMQSVGDDYVLVEPGERPCVHRVYNLLKQDMQGLARVLGSPAVWHDLETNWQGKYELDPETIVPGCMVDQFAIHGLIVPEIANAATTSFSTIDRREVFRNLAPSQWVQLPGAQTSGFMFATALTRKLPAFRAHLSADAEEIGASLSAFVAGLAS